MLQVPIKAYRWLREIVTKIYCKLNLQKYETPKGRKEIIHNFDAITLTLFKQYQGIATKKSLFEIIAPNCSYKTLVVSINRTLELLRKIIGYLCLSNRYHAHLVKHTDSTDLPVCSNRKIRSHKTMVDYAARSKTSKGWFYGLKLHISADLKGKILSVQFTSGNTDDRVIFPKLNRDLDGIFIADAGYISKDLTREFFIENRRILLAMPKKNMKKLATDLDIELFKTRMRIEDPFGNLKQFRNLTTTVCRSVRGYLVNYLSAVLSLMITRSHSTDALPSSLS